MRQRRHTRREERALQAAVQWAREHGFSGTLPSSLPKGRPDSCDQCPLARATGLMITSGAYSRGEYPLRWYELPALVTEFVSLFDHGRYPELIWR